MNRLVAKRVGILTGGGDCPGLNAVIRAVAKRSFERGWEVLGVRDGWQGLVAAKTAPLGPGEISGILPRGGTILGTTRTNPYKLDGGVDAVLKNFAELGLEVSMEEIARRADVGAATLYRRFPSKQQRIVMASAQSAARDCRGIEAPESSAGHITPGI